MIRISHKHYVAIQHWYDDEANYNEIELEDFTNPGHQLLDVVDTLTRDGTQWTKIKCYIFSLCHQDEILLYSYSFRSYNNLSYAVDEGTISPDRAREKVRDLERLAIHNYEHRED